jgi:two-component system C4-dicarboxylate transport sensor histidine kinase DctB
VNLATVFEEVGNLLKPELTAGGISFHPAKLPNPIYIHAHQIQLEQALINLVKNAIHAVEGETDPTIKIEVFSKSDSLEIHVIDNGPGLENATLTDLQEPFFSTKPSGVGMGLGLAIATEIIKDHGGELALGEVRNGATFVVTLPVDSMGNRS